MSRIPMPVGSPAATTWSPRRLQVPRTDRSLLCEPPLDRALSSAEENARLLNTDDLDLQGRSLSHMRRWARDACLTSAHEYTQSLSGQAPLGSVSDLCQRRLFVAGHQSALYHPGVWVKNFAIDHLAKASGGIGLNLVVDNDTFATTALRVPSGSLDDLSVTRIPFDADRPVQPWEDAEVIDEELFDSFGPRVARTLDVDESQVLLGRMWPDAIAQRSVSPRLVDCLTAARHRQEQRWGMSNLELPISRLCETEPFLWFASHLLVNLPRFSECHNTVLDEYRRLNRVRSRSHPVPALDAYDGWGEAPFWVWRRGDHVRRPVYARQQDHTLTLSDGTEEFARLPLSPEMDACCAVEELKKLPARGIRFRTRALTTTLFVRLCLSDLFVHGIGGAKYDEMTDQIIARFFGLTPPSFMTMSASLHLSLSKLSEVTADDARRLRHQLRDIDFNADRHRLGPQADALIAEKQHLIAAQRAAQTEGLSRRERRRRSPANADRYHRLAEVNARLASLADDQRAALHGELDAVERQLAVNRILSDREFSFALYPPDLIHDFFASQLVKNLNE